MLCPIYACCLSPRRSALRYVLAVCSSSPGDGVVWFNSSSCDVRVCFHFPTALETSALLIHTFDCSRAVRDCWIVDVREVPFDASS